MIHIMAGIAGAALLTIGVAGIGTAAAEPPAVQAQIDRALAIAGPGYAPVARHLCYLHSDADKRELATRRAGFQARPTRIFDNLYYVGAVEVAAWAYDTPDGIVIFDALNNSAEAEQFIVGGLRTLGLDPRRIRYVVISHGHRDHFGGATYLRDNFGARLIASEEDWTLMNAQADAPHRSSAAAGPIPDGDRVMADGATLGRGDRKIIFHITRGHTPGTLSATFAVRDHGRRRVVAFWGGVGIPTALPALRQYEESLQQFRRTADAAGADIGITNHPHADMSLEWIKALNAGAAAGTNPFVVGTPGVDRWLDVIGACAKAEEERLTNAR